MQNSTNVGGFLHRGSTTKNEVISKDKRMDRGQPGPRVIPERLELSMEFCKRIESSLIAITNR
jgi:hypothetical protein